MTDLDTYQPAAVAGYQPGMIMTPEDAKALDEQVRACTRAVLREDVDYGHIPGTGGEEKNLWRPGAQKLLQWFRLECTCERVEVERDDQGRKHGITYRAEVGRGLKTATPVILATCEGTADYDESKFYQPAEEVQRKAEYNERKWAKQYGRVADPTKWKDRGEYRADWNALMKRAQKRAIVGAVVDATAAGGIFTDREEDDNPAPQDDGPGWYEEALEAALTFTTQKAGRQLYTDAAQAARDGLCTPRQANHIQNRIEQRARLLKTATPVDVEDLARQAGGAGEDGQERRKTAAAGDDTTSRSRHAAAAKDRAEGPADTAGEGRRTSADPRAAGAISPRGAQPLPPLPGEEAQDDAADAVAKLFDRLVEHADHQLKQAGRCVYCTTCDTRLYQGTLPSAADREDLREYARQRQAETTPADAAEQLAPGEAAEYGTEQHGKLIGTVWAHLKRLGYPDDKNEDDRQRAKRLADTARLAGVSEIGSTSDLDLGELSQVADTLARCRNVDALKALLDAGEASDSGD